MKPAFYIAHQVTGRTRLRATERGDDRGWLQPAVTCFESIAGVLTVSARPATGSLVIQHEGLAWEVLAPQAEAQGVVFVPQPQAATGTGLAQLQSRTRQANELLRESSGGAMDMRNAGFVLMLGLAASQLLRGNLLAPASTYLWYALNLALDKHKEGPR